MTAEDIQNDLERMDHGDPELARAMENTRRKTLAKGLVHTEVLKSKTYETIKYLLKEWPNGSVIITDLDTGEEWGFADPSAEMIEAQERARQQMIAWARNKAA